jgi:cytochrome c
MTDRFNAIAGWVLFAGIVALGASIVTGELFHQERPEEMGYPIEGVEVEGEAGEADKPIAFYLASGDAAKGENVFKKCAACHNAEPGGANALGPALYGVMGNPVAGHPGFAFSDPLKSKGGTWDWETMSQWLANPKKFAPGTKMTFAGLGNPQDRADVMLFLNSRDSAPLPVPAAPAEAAPAEAAADGAQTAEKEPVQTEQQAVKGGEKNIGGSGAPKVTGTSDKEGQ